MNNKGFAQIAIALWMMAAFVTGSTAAHKYAGTKVTKDCVANGGTQSSCQDATDHMSLRNRLLALQK